MDDYYKHDKRKIYENISSSEDKRFYNCTRRQDMAPNRHREGASHDETIVRHRTWINNNNNSTPNNQSTMMSERKHYCRHERDIFTNNRQLVNSRNKCVDLDECDFMCSNSEVISGSSHRGFAASAMRFAPRFGIGAIFNKCWFNSIMLVMFCVLFVVSLKGVNCARHNVTPEFVDDSVQNYLSNFGYLPQSNSEAGNLRTEDQLREAIKNLQKFGHIPATGRIDERTKELLKKPRCGLPDNSLGPERRRRRFVQQGAVWNHTDLTWSLQKKPHTLDVHKVRAELSRALAVWSDHSKLTFREINSDKADIVISFVKRYHDDNYPFDGRGQILAHAFFPGTGRGGDAHFDDEEIWLLSDASEDEEGTSLFAVAAHEFGHSLGLSHSPVQGALMYPWYQGIKPNFELPEDDRLGIQNMYGVKEERMWGRIPVFTEPSETTTQRTENRPERPRWPQYPDRYPDYPRHRPTHQPRHPYYPERTPNDKRPINYPEKTPEYVPPRVPERRPVHTTTTTTTPKPRVPERKPDEYPDRRKYYPDVKYPERKPYPHYPHLPHHTTPRTYYPRSTEHPHKPEHPRKYYPKKPYHHPDKPWKDDRDPERRYPDATPTQDSVPKPDTCNTNYDAVALIRGEVFIFKSKYLWRIGDRGVMEGFPTFIHRMWGGLPADLTHVDAVYERPDRKIVFFIGKRFYVFNANELERGYPRPLTDLGLPESLEHLNAAMVWGHNGKTYFYNETMYWKFDEDEGKVELDYPRDMLMWKGVGNNIDSVFQWKDGKTYFFKGKGFWKFNDLHMRVEHEKQKLSAPFWMGCSNPEGDDDVSYGNKQPYQGLPPSPTSTFDFSKGNHIKNNSILVLLTLAIFFILNIDLR